MSQATFIEWADSTVNPTSGCQGCELWNKPAAVRHCYAGQGHERFSPSKAYPGPFEQIDLHPGRMAAAAAWSDLTGRPRPDKPWLDGMPRVIFVGDMGDIFSKAVPFPYLCDEVIGAATSPRGRRHIYMLLTKLPVRAVEFGRWLVEDQGVAWPENVWSGVSITSDRTAGRAEVMCHHPAPTKFLSVEPLLSAVEFPIDLLRNYALAIAGGESGPRARPCDLGWIRSIVEQCRDAEVPVFVKQLGARPEGHWSDDRRESREHSPMFDPRDGHWRLRDPKGGDIAEFPRDLRVRDFPRAPAPAARPGGDAAADAGGDAGKEGDR